MKKGITLVMVITMVSIMAIIITSASVIGVNNVNRANFEEYKSRLARVQDNVNAYYLLNNKLPVTNEIIDATSLGIEFKNTVALNKDETNRLFVVNMSLINDPTVKLGIGTIQNKDIFLVAENTNNVYYVAGYNFRGTIYYGN